MRIVVAPAVVCAVLGGCGDNKRGVGAIDAAVPDALACLTAGTKVRLQTVVPACDATHALPQCISGVVTLVTAPSSDPRLFALELHGRVRVIEEGLLAPTPFLDLTAENGGPVNGVGISELGLLGLAFHPNYAVNRYFYVFYTTDNPDTQDTLHPYLDVLARYRASEADPNVADPTSGQVLFAIEDPYPNHNAGMIEFGPEGLLYVATGDGGGDGTMPPDAFGNAQNPSSLLGKILRIDVDRTDPGLPYAIPPDNPFGNEVFVRGLRNPWRWSFDRATGDMWIGDVGEGEYEELDVLRPGEQRGANLGWKIYEGPQCFEEPCDPSGMTMPLDSRLHSTTGWWSIIGGQVYRGACYPDLVGTYFYTDCGAGALVTAKLRADGLLDLADTGVTTGGPSSLHADGLGELYVTDIYGNIFEIVVAP